MRISQERRIFLLVLAFFFIVTSVYFLANKISNKALAGWMNDNWLYRTSLTIGNTGSADSNKKVKFDIDTAALYSAGKIQIDCGDSRFTDINGRVLKYYIDSAAGACNTNSTDYYVLVPTIYSGNTVLYHYYGNPSAANGTQGAQFSQATFTPTSGPTAGSEEQSPGPIAYWKFDEGYGTAAQDSTHNNNDGSISSATWQTEDQCISGKCLSFDGSNDLITITNSNSLKTSTLTFSAWFKHNGTCSGTWCGIVERLGGSTSTNANRILVTANSNLIVQDSGTVTRLTSNTTFSSGKWYFIEVTISAGIPTLYVNGVLDKEGTAGTFSTGTNDLYLGRGSQNSNTYWFAGRMDDVKIYPYARTAAQIKSDYTARGSVKGTTASVGSQNPRESLSEGLVGYWKMDESAANLCSGGINDSCDSSGNSNDGAWNADATATVGKFGNGVTLDGTGDYVSIGNPGSLNPTSAITVSSWVYLDTRVSYSRSVDKTGSYLLEPSYSSGNGPIFCVYAGGAARCTSQTALTVPTSTWVHVVGTYDSASKTVVVYYNGSLFSSSILSGLSSYTITTTANNLVFGSYNGSDYFMDGKLDDVRIYNRALSPKEVRDLYNWAPAPVAHWKMDEASWTNDCTTTSVSDSSGNGNNGSSCPNGTGSTTPVNGKFGKAGNFDGTNDYINVADTTILKPAQITVSAWIYANSYSSWSTVVMKSTNGSWGDGYGLAHYTGTDNNINFFINNYSANKATGTITPGQWAYVTGTYDGANIKLYINGVLIQSTPYSTALSNSNSPLYIGMGAGGGGTQYLWKGKIDNVQIYNYARTQKQIVSDMNAGHPSVGSPVGSAVAYYKFDEGYGNTIHNSGSAGSAADGTASGTGWYNSGKYGKALDFEPGNDAMVNLGSSSSLNETGGLTFSTWLYTDAYTETWPSLYQRGSQSGVAGFIWIYQNSGSLNYQYANGGSVVTITSGCGLTTNAWQYVSLVHDRDNKKIFCYVNGVLKDTDTYTDTALTVTTGTAYFGTYQGSTADSYHLNGRLDETKIYNYALTEDEIKLDYNRGAAMVLGALSDTSGLAGGSVASSSASAEYCIPGDTSTCNPPVAEWKMDEGSWTGNCATDSVFDSSGNGNHGDSCPNASAPSGGKTGKFGKAGEFDGSNDYVYLADSPNWDFTSTTIEGWFYPTAFQSGDKLLMRDDGNTNRYWQIQLSGTSGAVQFLGVAPTAWQYNFTSTKNLTLNTWNHVAVTINAATDTAYMYFNGRQVGSDTATGDLVTGARQIEMGGTVLGSYSLKGKIDQVRIFNYARTMAQINWDYNRGDPVGWWKFDECQGNPYDSSGNGNNVTWYGTGGGTQTVLGTCTTSGTAWGNGEAGKYNASLNFDGGDDYVNNTSLSGTVLDFDDKSLISISLWAKIGGGANDYLIELPEISAGNNGPGIQYDSGNIYFHIVTHSDNSITDVYTPVNTSQWYMLTLTYDGTTLKGYKDGRLIGSHDVILGTGLKHAAKELNIGRFGTWGGYFNGQIDDVRIYNYALTPQQIKSLYNEGSAVRF